MSSDNKKLLRGSVIFILAATLLLFSQSCSKSSREYIEDGEKYVVEGRYNEAFIEFRNAIKKDSGNPEARYQIGLLYMRVGAYPDALQELEVAVRIDQNYTDAQLRIGSLLLLQRKYSGAREKAELVLSKNPNNIDAQILLANSWAGMIHVNDSMNEIREGLEQEPQLMSSFFRLGTGSDGSRLDDVKAEELYRKTVNSNEGSVEARLALGNFYMLRGRNTEAEEQYKAAAQNDPQSRDAVSALGFFYLRSGRPDKAEEQYKKYIDLSKDDPNSQVVLPDFYLAAGEIDLGIQVLEKMSADNPENSIFKRRLASVFFDQSAFDKAEKLADELIGRDVEDATANSVKGRILLSQNKGADAVRHLRIVTRRRPRSTQAHYFLGRAYQENGEPSKAAAELEFVIALDNTHYRAQLLLANLRLEAGNADEAIQLAQKALSLNPYLDEARLTLGSALTVKKDYADAAVELHAFVVRNPDNPYGLVQLGKLYTAQGNAAAAEARFEDALKNDPGNMPAASELAGLYMSQNRHDRAILRLNNMLSQNPRQASALYELLGRVYANRGDIPNAEEAFRRQASTTEGAVTGSINLAHLYRAQKSYDAAIAELQKIVSENPESGEAYAALGTIYEDLKDAQKAIEHYRAALKNAPGNATAANNLAFLLAENTGDLKEAEQLARRAREKLSNSATADTLAWIHFKRGAYRSAIDLLLDCVKQDPKNAVYFYHLGMAYFKNGDSVQAKEALKQALSLNPDIPQAAEIRSILE